MIITPKFVYNSDAVAVQMSDDDNDDVDSSDIDENDSIQDHADGEHSDQSDTASVDGAGNTGWANTFANVLAQSKPKEKSYLVLSKAKKLADKKVAKEKASKAPTFEIDRADGIKSEQSDDEEEKPSQEELDELALIGQRKERNNKLLSLRVKPTAMDRERERTFKRIATKGLVQLFNAVRTQQRDLVEKLDEAGPLDHRRDAVLNNINKRQFLDVLMGGKRAKSENVDNPVKDEDVKRESDDDDDDAPARPSQWSALRYLAGLFITYSFSSN